MILDRLSEPPVIGSHHLARPLPAGLSYLPMLSSVSYMKFFLILGGGGGWGVGLRGGGAGGGGGGGGGVRLFKPSGLI